MAKKRTKVWVVFKGDESVQASDTVLMVTTKKYMAKYLACHPGEKVRKAELVWEEK